VSDDGGGRGARLRSRGATLVDQVVSSASNLLAVLLVARSLDADGFGRFALAYAIVVASLGVSRSWFGTRLSLVSDPAAVAAEVRRAAGALVVLAQLLALAVLVPSWLLTAGADPVVLVAVALAAPVVCLQDALRFGAVSQGRPAVALASDAVWLVVLVAALPLAGRAGAGAVLGLWLGAAVAALLVAAVALRVAPDLRGAGRYLRTRHATSESLSYGTLVTLGAGLVVTSTVTVALGPAAAGALRGASTLMGPLNVLHGFVNIALTPALLRRGRSGDVRSCAAVAAALVAVVAVWGAVLLLLPDAWGRVLLGASWDGASGVLAFTVAEYVGVMVAVAAVLGLKVRHEAGVALLTVMGGCAAALLGPDVRWVAGALAVAAAVSALLGWHHLRASARRPVPQPGTAASPPPNG
jgi:O-antigen/teichoic acid export membrane protein